MQCRDVRRPVVVVDRPLAQDRTAYIDMTLEEQAAYRNLLDEASLRGGPVPNDDAILAKASAATRRWAKRESGGAGAFRPDAGGLAQCDARRGAGEGGGHGRARGGQAARGRRALAPRSPPHGNATGKRDRKPIPGNDNRIATNGKPIAPDPYPICTYVHRKN